MMKFLDVVMVILPIVALILVIMMLCDTSESVISDRLKKHPIRVAYCLLVFMIEIIPFAMLILAETLSGGIFNIATNGEWLGFWGGYLGSIIVIGGVYWQVNRQIKVEKENQFRQFRPFFLLTQEQVEVKKSVYSLMITKPGSSEEFADLTDKGYVNKQLKLTQNETLTLLEINNVSNKDMYAVKIFVTDNLDVQFINDFNKFVSLDEMTEYQKNIYNSGISIDKIGANEKAYFVVNNHGTEVKQAWVWYITEIRESVKLYFRSDVDGHKLEYCKQQKLLENQLTMHQKEKATYDLKDFHNSSKFVIPEKD